MGFASYSEDILKRHESDVHELMRELEAGHIEVARQRHVLPEFSWVLDQLKSVLSDPGHPVAVRLLELRARASTLESELSDMTQKRDVLSRKNAELNERVLRANLNIKTANQKNSELRINASSLQRKNASLKRELAEAKENILKLEKALFEAQVDKRY